MTVSADDKICIQVRGLRKFRGSREILRSLDLNVRCGEILVLLGSSGSGKTTLLRSMVGLECPDAGSVQIWGTDMYRSGADEISQVRRRIGMAFQGGALFGSMTVAENVELPLAEYTDMSPSKRRIVAGIKLGMVGLEQAMDLYPAELSGGMRKRASLARALALDPDIVFFDEPSAGLDPVTAASLDRLIKRLHKTFNMTIVVVTHEMESASGIADRLALLHEGRFMIIDTPAAVRATDDPFVRRFMNREPPDEQQDGQTFKQFIDDLSI